MARNWLSTRQPTLSFKGKKKNKTKTTNNKPGTDAQSTVFNTPQRSMINKRSLQAVSLKNA